MKKNFKKYSPGQAILVILLIMAVALTITLAVVSRSVTDIKISRQEEESARVFSAAEAGIEKALIAGAPQDFPLGGIVVKVSQVGDASKIGGGSEFAYAQEFYPGEVQTFWLVGHKGESLDPSLTYLGKEIELYWGNENAPSGTGSCLDNQAPALEATLIYDDGGFKAAKYPADADWRRAGDCNHFSQAEKGSPTFTVAGKKFKFRNKITLPARGINYVLRLKLLYNETPQPIGLKSVAVFGPLPSFPAQGQCFDSTARHEQSGVTRTIQQCRFYKVPPVIFDYVLYSEKDLVK